MLVLLIALGWTAWLAAWFRRREAHPNGSIDAFHQQLSTLSALDRAGSWATKGAVKSAPSPRPVLAAPVAHPVRHPRMPSRREVRRRRREVLCALVAAAGLTLGLALVTGLVALYAHLLVDAALLTYVALLARAQKLAIERQVKVRYMPRRSAQPTALLLRRSASS